MLTQNQIATLKKGNVSVNLELTKARVLEDFKAASAAEKKSMLELAGMSSNAYYVVGKRGTVSARQVAAMSVVLGNSPYYYTGESDDQKPFTGEILEGFVAKHKDEKVAKPKGKSTKQRATTQEVKTVTNQEKATPKAEVTEAIAETATPKKSGSTLVTMELDYSPEMNKAVANLDVDSAVVLLKALSCKAKIGDNAAELYNTVKRCLLS